MKASVVPEEFPVTYSVSGTTEFIQFDVPNGWDDVKKLTKKVLLFDGKKFTFSCWNSDHLYCAFRRQGGVDPLTARIVRK